MKKMWTTPKVLTLDVKETEKSDRKGIFKMGRSNKRNYPKSC